jgi:poly(A) polymerase
MANAERRREFATEVVRKLREAGYEALWAGGCVRDLLLGHLPSDYDVATSATPEQVMQLYRNRTVAVGASFGVVRVRSRPRQGPADEVEVATFRSDGQYRDGRRPESIVFSTPREDASRRDFTINGMFLDPLNDALIDYVGGRADLQAGVLRAIGDPVARFDEDKLRLIRAVRFAARFGLRIEPATRAAVVAMSPQITVVSAERIAQELRRMLVDGSRAVAMKLALETGILAAVLPPLIPFKGIFQGKPYLPEGDLWDHTMLVLKFLPPEPSFTLAFAALLHEVGKPATRSIHDWRDSNHHHERAGREIADRLCRQLKLSNAERERITWLVENHQSLVAARQLRESKLKRILAHEGIEELLQLHRADALASRGECPDVDYCEDYLRAEPDGPVNPPPLVTGHDLVRHGLSPGAHFAIILERIRDAQLNRTINTKQEALTWVDRWLAEEGRMPG